MKTHIIALLTVVTLIGIGTFIYINNNSNSQYEYKKSLKHQKKDHENHNIDLLKEKLSESKRLIQEKENELIPIEEKAQESLKYLKKKYAEKY